MNAQKPKPQFLSKLPRIEYTNEEAANRLESAREDLAFGVRTVDDIVKDAVRRSRPAAPEPPSSARQSARSRKSPPA